MNSRKKVYVSEKLYNELLDDLANIFEHFWEILVNETGTNGKGGGCLFAANQTQFHANPKEADRDSRTERSSPYRYFSISGNYILNWGGDEFNHRDHNWIL